MATATGRQAKPSGTSRAEGMLLPAGLGKEQHLGRAREQHHNYGSPATLETDLQCAIEAVARCEPHIEA